MYQVFNAVTGEAMPVLAESPYELAGPLAERRTEQKRDEEGNLVYLTQTEVVDTEQYYDADGNYIPATDPNEVLQTKIIEVETTESGYTVDAVLDDDGNEIEPAEFVAYPPVMVDAGPMYEWREVVPTEAEILAEEKAEKLAEISAKLAALDLFLPRALEDFWEVENYDITKLPQIQQDRLAQKIALRVEYSTLK